jgi:hypothetical protein
MIISISSSNRSLIADAENMAPMMIIIMSSSA